MTQPDFKDYFAICDTKARYCRFLDEKNWNGWGELFAVDAVLDTRPSGGTETHGRAALVDTVRTSLANARTAHQVHSPEISMTDSNTADVIWAMQDRVVWDEARARESGLRSLTGYGHYRERYTRGSDGTWRIARSTLTRLHVDFERHAEAPAS